MSLNKLFIIFGVILVIFVGVIFFQFRGKTNTKTDNNITATTNATAKIGNRTFKVEVVDTPQKQQQGLSGRNSLDQDSGMLFIFDKADYHNFWMKNMKFPIDIIFIKGDKIVSIEKSAKPPASTEETLPIYRSEGQVDKVLEINAGLSEKYNIKVGDKVEIKLPK